MTIRLRPILLVVAGLMLAAGVPAQAGIIAEFTFPTTTATNPPGPIGYEPVTVGAGVTVEGIVVGSGMTDIVEISNPTPHYATEPVLRLSPAGSTTEASAIANNRYFEFTVDIDPGQSLDLMTLAMDAARGGGATQRGFAFYTSLDGFADAIHSGYIPAQRPNFTHYEFDLSGFAYQDLTGSVDFRFYVYSPSAGNTVEFDNIVLTGEAVPEPATPVLCGAGMLTCLWRRHRKSA